MLLLSCIQDLSLLREVETQKNEVEELRERSSTEKGDIPTNKDDKAERMATGKGDALYSAMVKGPHKKEERMPLDHHPGHNSSWKGESCGEASEWIQRRISRHSWLVGYLKLLLLRSSTCSRVRRVVLDGS